MPNWNGFSGMYNGIGTDDSRYYAAIADNFASIPVHARVYSYMNDNFGNLLKILYPFQINHPLSIIIPNIIGISFIPYFTYKTSLKITGDFNISKISFLLVSICPLILSNGLILMRDGWCAFLTIAGIYFIIEKKIIHYLIILALLSYIRLGSGLLLAIVPLFFLREIFSVNSIKKAFIFYTIIIFIFLFFVIGLPFIAQYLNMKGVSGLSRQEFVENFMWKSDNQSVIYSIYTMPFYLRIPIGFIFFLFLPFLKLQFFTEGIFNLRTIMFTTLMPILSLLYFKYFLSAIIFSKRNKEKLIKRFLYLFLFLIFIISQLSLQPRHKTEVMPLFYILVAYGIFNNSKLSRHIGITFVIFFGLVEVLMLIKF